MCGNSECVHRCAPRYIVDVVACVLDIVAVAMCVRNAPESGNIKKHVNLSALCHIFVNRIFCYMHEHFNCIFFNGTRLRWRLLEPERAKESREYAVFPFLSASTIVFCWCCWYHVYFAGAFGLSFPIYLR